MEIKIIQAGSPMLRQRAAEVPVDRIKTAEIQDLIDIMIAVMRAAPGVGLAAPQLGISLRVIVLEDSEQAVAALPEQERLKRERVAFPLRVFINPVLRHIGEESASLFEGCLSVKGYVALVARRLEVEVSGLDRNGLPQTWRVRGWPARILQHEVDHLDGTLFVDRMDPRSFTAVENIKPPEASGPDTLTAAGRPSAPPA